MFRKIGSKRGVAALSVIAVLALAGAAYAYFSSSGSGTGTATVGSASPFTITPATATGGPLLPGSGTQTINYTVTNASSGHQQLTTTTAAPASSGGNVTTGPTHTAVAGCLAAWFTVTNTPPSAADLAGGAFASGSLTVTMSNVGSLQDNCQGVTPDITISAS